MHQLILTALLITAPAGQATETAAPAVCQVVDREIRAAWQDHHIAPAPTVDDARFLRRVSLDITGRLPTRDQVVKFLDDSDPAKRAGVVDELLASPSYANHWADYWDAILMGRLTREATIERGSFKQWIREQFAQNISWEKFVHELVAAEGWNSKRRPGKATTDPPDMVERYSPATNWFIRYQKSLPELSAATSKLFLGVQLQCAQCHDHKTEKWKQQDFRQFTAFFVKTWPDYYDKTLVVGIHRLDTKEHWIKAPVNGKYAQYFTSYKDYVDYAPKFLDGQELRGFGSRRKALADWMVSAENPWFAQAIVNRLWGKFLGTGFVEPVDDFRPGNPPILPETLAALTDDFKRHGHDLRRLIRVICATEAYQRACHVDKATPAEGPRYWASYPLKQLDVEELFDVVLQATDAETYIDRLSKQNLDLVRTSFARQFVTQLGTDDMAEVANFEETIPRALMLLNGALLNGTTRQIQGMGLTALVQDKQDDAYCIEELYLRTLSRRPTAAELSIWKQYVTNPRPLAATAGPATGLKTGPVAQRVDPAIADAPENADFKELLDRANSAADFAALRKRMKNNADGGLFVKAFEAWIAEVPFQALAAQPGGNTPRQQAFEDLYWALLNSTEFLTNH
jgi:hypothetical protein